MRGRIRKVIAVVSAVGMCISFSMGAYAAWRVSGDTDNILTMAVYQTRIVEKYRVPEHVDPSQTVSKIVNVTNTGKVDTLVRVAVTRQFGRKTADGTFLADKSLDPEMILIHYNTALWLEKDGYFYYRDILKAGTTTKEPLLSSYTLSPKAGNAYQGADAQIIINMESVQAEGNAAELWGVTCKDLGISALQAPEPKETGIAYYGKDRGFDITTSKTDLFAGFKNLLPGCGRTQMIQVENRSSEEAEILLHAESTEQDRMSEIQKVLVNQLLNRYARIEIKAEGTVIYNGPVSGIAENSEKSMNADISLGNYKAGEAGKLAVKLTLSPDMDNKFEALTGKVKWVFSVRGEDAPQSPANTILPAKTGLNEPVIWNLAAFLGFLLLGCFSCIGACRKGRSRSHA